MTKIVQIAFAEDSTGLYALTNDGRVFCKFVSESGETELDWQESIHFEDLVRKLKKEKTKKGKRK